MDTRSREVKLSEEAFDEVFNAVSDAVKRPCHRVYVGRYVSGNDSYTVYIQVEPDDASKRDKRGR